MILKLWKKRKARPKTDVERVRVAMEISRVLRKNGMDGQNAELILDAVNAFKKQNEETADVLLRKLQ